MGGVLLAFDLDNTVVTRDHALPPATDAAIRTARDAGHLVTVLTGRPLASATPFVEALDVLPGPYSVNHGALVFGRAGEVLKRRRMTGAHVEALLSAPLRPPDVPYACMVDDALFVEDPADPRWSWAHTANRRVERYAAGTVQEADKVVFSSNGRIADLQATIAAEHDLTFYRWNDGYLEITARDADKGAALALIAETLAVAREDVVAFGDGANDVTMLAWAGHGVSVGPHASPEVRAAAQEHVDAPEEGGVAGWLAAHAHG